MGNTNRLTDAGKRVWSVRYSPEGGYLAGLSTTSPGVTNKTLSLWKLPERKLLAKLDSWSSSVIGINSHYGFSPDGRLLTAPGANGQVHVWDTSSREGQSSYLEGGPDVRGARFLPDGKRLVVWGVAEEVSILDASTGEILDRWAAAPATGRGVQIVEVAPDGGLAAAVARDQGRVVLRNLETKEKIKELTVGDGLKDVIVCLAIDEDSARTAAGTTTGKIIIWDNNTGERLAKLDGHVSTVNTLAFCHDGQSLASAAGDSTLAFWNTEIYQRVVRLDTLPLPGELSGTGVTGLSFHPEMSEMVTGSGSERIQFWSAPAVDLQPESGIQTD